MIGCTIRRNIPSNYWKTLRFAEFAYEAVPPKAKTLSKQREQMPQDMICSILVKARILEENALEVATAADRLGACAVVVETSTEVTPGARGKNKLRSWIDKLQEKFDRHIAWQAAGVWEHDSQAAFAKILGITPVIDLLEEVFEPDQSFNYGRIVGLGARRRISETTLALVAEQVSALSSEATSMVAIDAPSGPRLATRLAELAAPISI